MKTDEKIVDPWDLFGKSIEKIDEYASEEEKGKLFVSLILLLLELGEAGQKAAIYLLKAQGLFRFEDLAYLVVKHIADADYTRTEASKKKDELLNLWTYLKENHPEQYAHIFRVCCLEHLRSGGDAEDFSKYFKWGGFTREKPADLFGSAWLKELLLFYAGVNMHNEITARIFNSEFMYQFSYRSAKELGGMINPDIVLNDHKDLNQYSIDLFCYIATIVQFGLAEKLTEYDVFRTSVTYHQNIIDSLSEEDQSVHLAAISLIHDCALYFHTLNQRQFAEKMKETAFKYALPAFIGYYKDEEGWKKLQSKDWFRKLNNAQELALKS